MRYAKYAEARPVPKGKVWRIGDPFVLATAHSLFTLYLA